MVFERDINDDGTSYNYTVGWRALPETSLPQLSVEELFRQGDKIISYDRQPDDVGLDGSICFSALGAPLLR